VGLIPDGSEACSYLLASILGLNYRHGSLWVTDDTADEMHIDTFFYGRALDEIEAGKHPYHEFDTFDDREHRVKQTLSRDEFPGSPWAEQSRVTGITNSVQ
jgi:hypothetical protein